MIFSQIKKNFVVFFSDVFAKELGIYNILFQFKKYFLLLQSETCHIKKTLITTYHFEWKAKYAQDKFDNTFGNSKKAQNE
jgi:hypothetical protein